MSSLLRRIDAATREKLLRDINYLNLGELHGFCRKHGVPVRIHREEADGRIVATRDNDRKLVVLERLVAYLRTGKPQAPTLFVRAVIAETDPPRRFRPEHQLFYGWYDKHNEDLLRALKELSGGSFRSGAVARILARDYWTRGEAPTLRDFATAWVDANARGLGVDEGRHPEAAWLTDRARGEAGSDWKAKRLEKAEWVLGLLAQIPLP